MAIRPRNSEIDASGRLLADVSQGDNMPPLSVSEISGALKRVVEDRFGRVRIRGEISGWKRAASGHCYLGLKDDNALIDGVMWKGNAARIAFAAEDGLDVIATGKITTYPGRSKYQIVIDSLELAGEGALMQLFEKLKAKLAGEGLFDPAMKRPLPSLPRTIGVVTSPTGAVIRDILHRLEDRFPSHVIVWPTIVQGEGAAAKIAAAVEGFSSIEEGGPIARPDLIIVARGGGSIEDLWAFNEEVVVRAVAGCSIPVISAVGHETDTTLCDFAADVRAPTPTAAAEMAVPVRGELMQQLGQARLRLQGAAQRSWSLAGERLEAQRRLLPKPAQMIEQRAQRIDDLAERLAGALSGRAAQAETKLARASGGMNKRLLDNLLTMKTRQLEQVYARMNAAQERQIGKADTILARVSGGFGPHILQSRFVRARRDLAAVKISPQPLLRAIDQRSNQLDALWRVAQQLHPDKPLARGYARITDTDGQTLTSAKAAQSAQYLMLHFADGKVPATTQEGTPPPLAKRKPATKPAEAQAVKRQGSLF